MKEINEWRKKGTTEKSIETSMEDRNGRKEGRTKVRKVNKGSKTSKVRKQNKRSQQEDSLNDCESSGFCIIVNIFLSTTWRHTCQF